MKGDNPTDCDGFSLLEMLVVLGVFSLVTLVAMNSASLRRSNVTAKTISEAIGDLAANASLRAISRGETETIAIDVQKRLVTGDPASQPILIPDNYKLRVVTGAELIQQANKADVLFFSDGSSTGGEITITDNRGGQATVRVHWLTGAVSMSIGLKK